MNDLSSARSVCAAIGTVSESRSLDGSSSPGVLTVAKFVTEGTASANTNASITKFVDAPIATATSYVAVTIELSGLMSNVQWRSFETSTA